VAISPASVENSIARNINKICGVRMYDGTALKRITTSLFIRVVIPFESVSSI
jgi:hypothetical protein